MKFFFVFFLAAAQVSAKVVPEVWHHTVGDLRHTFLSWPALVIAGGALGAVAVKPLDDNVSAHFAREKSLGGFDKIAAFAGQPYVLDPAALAVFAAGKIFHNEEVAFTGENLFEALIFTDAVTGGLKLAFRRERPNGSNYGFPSGHAATFFAVATVLEELHGPAFGVPAYAVAGLVSFSRLDANAHNLSDVVFGAALGTAIGWGTSRFHKHEDQHLFLVPMAAGAPGVTLTYLN